MDSPNPNFTPSTSTFKFSKDYKMHTVDSITIPAFISSVRCSLLELKVLANVWDSSRQSRNTNNWEVVRKWNIPSSVLHISGHVAVVPLVCRDETFRWNFRLKSSLVLRPIFRLSKNRPGENCIWAWFHFVRIQRQWLNEYVWYLLRKTAVITKIDPCTTEASYTAM